ncbi:hypothetical protein GDO81_024348 [Engystomops pustulosus]|uniref:Secreted protein n=1 Tax=Engystomops pustulosus TaxID=76066 RepID=A0AAV6Z3J4_ENGPU|nr:hypothetical protein GDO81_024348 [Engystomops pustulosus]
MLTRGPLLFLCSLALCGEQHNRMVGISSVLVLFCVYLSNVNPRFQQPSFNFAFFFLCFSFWFVTSCD